VELRVILDVNVWVANYLGAVRGRAGTTSQRIADAVFAGHCRLGPIKPLISPAMLDTLQGVLEENGLTGPEAEFARNAVEATTLDADSLHVVLGGGVQPMKDAEDAAILDLALAGRVHLLVTNNIADFRPGPRADIDAHVVRLDRNRKADVVLFRHPRLPEGLVITTSYAAAAWLLDGVRPPSGILTAFCMSASDADEPAA